MPKKTANCQNCGEPYNQFPKNRKYCGACQALRDLDYRPGMHKDCEWCGKKFFPYRTNYNKCYECSGFRTVRPDEWPECQRCGKHKRMAPGLTNTCVACVQEDRDTQHTYHRSLSRIVTERKIKNNLN